jgi:putative phosphoesterase
MIIGVMSDTHGDKQKAIPHIIAQFVEREVELIVDCGDIAKEDVSKPLFGDLPVICALVDGQNDDPFFVDHCPEGWKFTRAGNRVTKLPNGELVYVGHKMHAKFLKTSEEDFNAALNELRQKFDGLRIVFGGHLHFQTYMHGNLVNFINPGSVGAEGSIGWGYEFATVDTDTREVVFSRILPESDSRSTWSLGVISDSLDISLRSPSYWGRLVQEMQNRGVNQLIHCGNLALDDIGRPELKDFTVHFAIRPDQKVQYLKKKAENKIPGNWKVLAEDKLNEGALVHINGYNFYVQLDLGFQFITMNEHGMDSIAMKIRRDHQETEFVLCGFTREALLVEGQQVVTINPGNVNADRSFAVICFPRREVTFGHVPYDPLPELPKG